LPALGPRGEGWVLGQFVLLWAVVVAAAFGGTPLAQPAQTLVHVVGAALLLIGLSIVGLAAVQLRQALSVLPRPTEKAMLVQTGLYRRVRHPIYAGVVLAGAGGSLYAWSPSAALATIALAVWLDVKARREEAWLMERFSGYADYGRRTTRFLPAIY
jgi:protein-S-isoprenylcysteine O-methyltransferase Ste14